MNSGRLMSIAERPRIIESISQSRFAVALHVTLNRVAILMSDLVASGHRHSHQFHYAAPESGQL
jgi:hypothetical protein